VILTRRQSNGWNLDLHRSRAARARRSPGVNGDPEKPNEGVRIHLTSTFCRAHLVAQGGAVVDLLRQSLGLDLDRGALG